MVGLNRVSTFTWPRPNVEKLNAVSLGGAVLII